MPKLSPLRAGVPLLPGLKLIHRGKVRDTYQLTEMLLLSVATDAISIFDFVLNALILGKGIVLNCMNHFWARYLSQFGIKTHLVAAGADIDEYLPEHLKGNPDLQARAIVIRKLKMASIEFIARIDITGSGFESYRKHGHVCGHVLPPGLQDGDALPCILDTPTSKAEVGHDEHLPADEIRRRYPEQTYTTIKVAQIASSYSRSRGIELADTKLELGECGTVGDEIVTPDSSRFWPFGEWQNSRKLSQRKAPTSLDKQFVREWGKKQGIDQFKDPEDPDQVAKVHALELPEDVAKQTSHIYRYIFWRQSGQTTEDYLPRCMGVHLSHEYRKIAVVCGSDSDISEVECLVERMGINITNSRMVGHIISCHRNPKELDAFVRNGSDGLYAIICAGGKAFALPGVLDARLHAEGKDIPVVGVALGEPGSNSLKAAELSIEELPGQPVIMDEINGGCYSGKSGLERALWRVATGELPPRKPRVEKPVQMEVFKNF